MATPTNEGGRCGSSDLTKINPHNNFTPLNSQELVITVLGRGARIRVAGLAAEPLVVPISVLPDIVGALASRVCT